jgi:hypothetical protein
MSGNLLTVLVGVAGLAAAIQCFRLGARQADRQHTELLAETARHKSDLGQQNVELGREVREVRSILAAFLREGGTQSRGHMHSVSLDRISPVPRNQDASGSAVDLLVRASLGALLNERGEVHLQRLLDEVCATLGAASLADTIFVLQRLRSEGVVDWDGAADLSDAQVIRVRPPGEHRYVRASPAGSGMEAT